MANTKDLLKAGLLTENEILIWKRRVQGSSHEAHVSSDGLIHTSDGKSHKTPSGAAKHLNGNKPVDGWIYPPSEKPGLGIEIIEEVVDFYRQR